MAKGYRANGASVWKYTASLLSRPRRRQIHVNLSEINRVQNEKETVLVPGRVLGSGRLEHPVRIAALAFTASAKAKIKNSGGECLTIEALLKTNPGGADIRLMG